MAVRPRTCNEGSRRGFLPGVLWFTDPTWEIGMKLATPGTGLQEGSDRAGRVPGAPGGAGLGTRSTLVSLKRYKKRTSADCEQLCDPGTGRLDDTVLSCHFVVSQTCKEPCGPPSGLGRLLQAWQGLGAI